MTTTCIINNYNYEKYIADAIDSAINQTVKFDEIIIVDDGSTDKSREIILDIACSNDKIKYIFKDNGGQMSALNCGYQNSTGDLVCFLDSDDLYNNDYLEKTLNILTNNNDYDFIFCAYEMFGKISKKVSLYPIDTDLGISVVRVNQKKTWIGGPTSTLAIRRQLAEKIFPYPHAEEWRSRADDIIIFAASLVGARKYFNAATLVQYRIHSDNSFQGRKTTEATVLNRDLAVIRLFNYYRSKMGYDVNLSDLAWKEFRTIPRPNTELFKVYLRIIRDGVARLPVRFKYYKKLIKYFILTKRS